MFMNTVIESKQLEMKSIATRGIIKVKR